MTKKEKLEQLDKLVLDKMISHIETGKTELLSELSVPANYLKANAVVEEKKRDSIEDEVQKRLEVAEERRKKKAEDDEL